MVTWAKIDKGEDSLGVNEASAERHNSPYENTAGEVNGRARARQDEVAGDLAEDVADEEDRDGRVEVGARHAQVSLETLDSGGSQGVAIKVVEDQEDKEHG